MDVQNFSMIFLSAGLFMGWSLGGNDAANIFGTAVATKMVSFGSAALICVIFITMGAMISGSGPTETIGALGEMQSIVDAFIVAVSAAVTVALMTRYGLPVSTSQALVGAIIGWNLFMGQAVNLDLLYKISSTWVLTPIISAVFSILTYGMFRLCFRFIRIGVIDRDRYIRWGLLLVGAFGAYSLGANNIANVMGVYSNVTPLTIEQLFLLGSLAIGFGVVTYSKRVMLTVGKSLFKLSPMSALIVVFSSAMVLFIFSSESLNSIFVRFDIPLVPVSQSQAVVGAILGIGIVKGGRSINFRILYKIGLGWVATPVAAMLLSFLIMSVHQITLMW